MSRKFYALLLALFTGINLWAQFPGWAWEKTPTGFSSSYYYETPCTTDASGNLYVAGNFASPGVMFGTHALSLTDSGGNNIFVAKYDAGGNALWAQTAGGDRASYASGVAVDNSGNVYVCGIFFGDSIIFPGTILHTNHLISIIESGNLFIAKYDPTGNFLWARAEDTTSYGVIEANAIAISPAGGFYIAGSQGSVPIIYGGDTILSTESTNINALLIKFDDNGNVLWVQNPGAASSASALGVAVDKNDNAYITGFYDGGAMTVGNATLNNAGYSDVFTAKYNGSGNPLWAQSIGGMLSEQGNSIAVDAQNNVYITGFFSSDTVVFGGIHIARGSTGANGADFMLAKYDSAGNAQWLQQASGNNINQGQTVTIDNQAHIFVAGNFSSTALSFSSASLNNVGGADGFVADFNSSGALVWVEGIQGTGDDYAWGIIGDGRGNCYVAGMSTSNSLSFGNNTFSNPDTPNYGIFIAKAGFATGIEAPVNSAGMMVYPNPCFTGTCQLHVTNDLLGSTLQVLDMSGRLIYKTEITNPQSQIPVAGFDAGMYLLKLNSGNTEVAGKLVVGR